MKYTWIDYKAYLNFDNLKNYIDTVLKHYGKDFIIDFTYWDDKSNPAYLVDYNVLN
jgi:hypothetical protein